MPTLNGDDEDLSWLDDTVRHSAVEMLDVLFASSTVCVITFDGEGTIVGVNPHTRALDGRTESRYAGINLLSNLVFRRVGWARQIQRVLAGETIELTDSRWVTLISREERFVDVIAGPVTHGDKVIGGVAYLIDATRKHRAEVVDSANRQRARELEAFLARDVVKLLAALESWSRGQREPAAPLVARVNELSDALDDLLHFIQLGTYQPQLERMLLTEAVEPGTALPPEAADVAVMADRRLLRHILRNLMGFSARKDSDRWSVQIRDGRVILEIPVEQPKTELRQLLIASPASTAEASSAHDSVAAARWMTESLSGTLTVLDSGGLRLNLPAADPALT